MFFGKCWKIVGLSYFDLLLVVIIVDLRGTFYVNSTVDSLDKISN